MRLTAMARKKGIQVARSQVRRIFRQEKVRWRHTRLWASSKDPDFVPKERASSGSTPTRPRAPRSSASTSWPRNPAQLPAGSGLVARWPPDQGAAQLRPGTTKVWVYGALSVRDGQALTQTARSRNTTGYLDLLQTLDRTYPSGDLYLIADNLASHTSGPIREWLEAHPRIEHAFIPVGAAG